MISSPALAPFALLWAFALLYHQIAYRWFLASPLDAALTLAAVVVMLRPRSTGALVALATLHVAVVLHQLPQVSNHWYFGGLVSLGLVVAATAAWWRAPSRDAMPSPAALVAAFAPVAQACLLLVYFLSGFHKLNHDFFTPGISCASVLSTQAAGTFRIPWAMPEPGSAEIWLTVLVELGLPVLLVVARWRTAGILLALGFHVVMAAAGYPRFSATGVALLTLFLPAEAWQPWGPRLRLLWRRFGVAGALGAAAAALGFAFWAGPRTVDLAFLGMQWFLAVAVGVVAIAAWHGRLAATRPVVGGWREAGPAWVVPLLVIAIATTPYLGLNTHRALSMYSNLRTEGGVSNHFIIPASLQVFGFQRDLVTVQASSAATLQHLADQGMLLPFQEFRALVADAIRLSPDIPLSVRYRRDGRVQDVADASTDPQIGLPLSWAATLFLRFRPIEASGPRRCTV